jgi:hypothetical protein
VKKPDDDKTVLVCMPIEGPLILPDNLTGRCEVCDCRVQYRPHAQGRFDMLRCMSCAVTLMQPEDEIVTTQEMVEDVLTHLRKQQQ